MRVTFSVFYNRAALPLLFLLLLAACSGPADKNPVSEPDLELNNRGVALMGSFQYGAAVEVFADLVERNPDWHLARTNLAIALKNRQQIGDGELALNELALVLESKADDARANYNAGVLHLYEGRVAPASDHFQAVLKVDPQDAYAHYYLGQCQLRLGDQQAALASYQAAIDLDPYLRSAYYSAAQVLRQLGRDSEATASLAQFTRFENNPAARLAEFKYTRMGPKSIAAVGRELPAAIETQMPVGELFANPHKRAQLTEGMGHGWLGSVDFNADGAQDIVIDAKQILVADGPGAFGSAPVSVPWVAVTDINAVAWGDIDNNGLVDAYLCRDGADQLWQQSAKGSWSSVDAAIGENQQQKCVDAALVDADHDGDLDILLLNQNAGAELMNNNRDGSFTSLRSKMGVAKEVMDGQHLLATDLDNDRDVDLVYVSASGAPTILLNDRLWNYVATDAFSSMGNKGLRSMAATDIDADGQIELFALDKEGQLEVWDRSIDNIWRSHEVLQTSATTAAKVDLAVQDINGDGQAEVLLLARGKFEVIGLQTDLSGQLLESVTYKGGQAVPMVLSNQGASLLAVTNSSGEGALTEWAPGSGRLNFLTLNFSGKHDAAETMRSNFSGVGTQVGARVGSRWSRTDTFKNSSLAGQSSQPIAIGIGRAESADFIEVDWSDGVYQTELNVAANSTHVIAEEQRQLGSCPVLFTWDGSQFKFVTDILGVGAQGFLVEPGTLLPPRPWEYVPFAPGSLRAKNGEILFKLTEPMEESSYIDAMTLHAYDVPHGWELLVDERMGTGAPQVTGQTMFARDSIAPVQATNSDGEDVLDAVLAKDNQAQPLNDIDRRFIGILEDYETLTLEFDQPISVAQNRIPVLVADGWIELPYSQTHFAAWQAGKSFGSVSLSAKTANGEWQEIYPDFGIPAGMPRVTTLPLLDLPDNTTSLRLRWNREIYWDRIRVAFAEPSPDSNAAQVIQPKLAMVEKSGFSKRLTHAQRRPEYRYAESRPFGDVRYPTGFYTALGEMTELVSARDDALAIIAPGEGIHVAFEEPPAPKDGFQRWYVLETRGWAKDKDMYTNTGNTVEPLPRAHPDSDAAQRAALHNKYNTRFLSGR